MRWNGRLGHIKHDHDFLEVVAITGGRGMHRTEMGTEPLARGDVLVLRPGVWHAYEAGRELAGWDCCIDPGLPGCELAWTVDDPDLGRLLWNGPMAKGGHLRVQLDEASMCELERLLAALHDAPTAGRAWRIGVLLQLLGLVASALPATAPHAPAHPAVAAALRLIEQDPSLPWTLSGLALRLHLQPGYLARIFRRATGLPPLAYVHRRRAEIAAGLLARTALPVAEIGARVGWPDANLFARRFRALLGVSPSQWRMRGGAPTGAIRSSPGGTEPRRKKALGQHTGSPVW